MVKYTKEMLSDMAFKIGEELVANESDMKNHMLMDVIVALERGEDVDEELLSKILSRPLMDKFIDELLKYEE